MPAFSQTGLYQFGIDQDNLAGAPDFSFLNHPLTAADRIVVQNGHFCRIGDGSRVRFFGVAFAFGADFPAASDAVRIAQRLRRLGVNIVRLHHMDTEPDSNPQTADSSLTTGPYPTLNTVSIARLRTFLNALSAQGIYVDLNLHVGYQFRPTVDNVPAMPDGAAFPTQSKPLQIFYPRMVSLQVQYAQNLINALSLKNDPVLAVVEIDNETSLLQAWQTGEVDTNVLGAYQTELQRQWNVYLATQYASTSALRTAWGASQPAGPQLLTGTWQAEIHSPAQATMTMTTTDGLPTVQVDVTQGGNPVIAKMVGFSIAANQRYIAQVDMRADIPANASASVEWDVKQDTSPWNEEKSTTVLVTNQWQTYTMDFQAGFGMTGIGRFGLSVENVPGNVYIRNWSLTQAPVTGLDASESLEAGTVALVGAKEAVTVPRANDYLLFLTNRDQTYVQTILAAVQGVTDTLVPVTGTQMAYGGLLDMDSQAGLAYQDNHFYIDHYSFPDVDWDSYDWRIQDASALTNGLSQFQGMAIAHEAGRPYTVSEYNQPWPNTHGAAIDPTLATFAAFQDWDAIMHFDYSEDRDWDGGVPVAFSLKGDWTKFANAGQAAWLFRSGAIRTGAQPLEIPVSQSLRLQSGRQEENGSIGLFLQGAVGYQQPVALEHPVRITPSETGTIPSAALTAPGAVIDSDTAETTMDTTHNVFLIHAASAAGVFGFVGQTKYTAGALDVTLGASARGFVSMLLTPLDGRSLADSRDLLLSNPGYTLRSQPGTTPASPQNIVNYPGTTTWYTLEQDPAYLNKPSGYLDGGTQPVWMERVEATVAFRTSAAQVTVYPLDGTGKRLVALSGADVQRTSQGFQVHLQATGQSFSPWYEVVATPRGRRGRL